MAEIVYNQSDFDYRREAGENQSSLKKILNIAEPSSMSPSVHELFETAGGSNCTHLVSVLGERGLGVPRYDYVTDPVTGSVTAQVTGFF